VASWVQSRPIEQLPFDWHLDPQRVTLLLSQESLVFEIQTQIPSGFLQKGCVLFLMQSMLSVQEVLACGWLLLL